MLHIFMNVHIVMFLLLFWLGSVHKRRPNKLAKNWPPLSALAQPPSAPLSVRTHHKFQKIRSILHQKVRTSASEEPPGQTPLTADVFYGRPLMLIFMAITSLSKRTQQAVSWLRLANQPHWPHFKMATFIQQARFLARKQWVKRLQVQVQVQNRKFSYIYPSCLCTISACFIHALLPSVNVFGFPRFLLPKLTKRQFISITC